MKTKQHFWQHESRIFVTALHFLFIPLCIGINLCFAHLWEKKLGHNHSSIIQNIRCCASSFLTARTSQQRSCNRLHGNRDFLKLVYRIFLHNMHVHQSRHILRKERGGMSRARKCLRIKWRKSRKVSPIFIHHIWMCQGNSLCCWLGLIYAHYYYFCVSIRCSEEK